MARRMDDSRKHILDEALRQLADARLQGREPDVEACVKRHPEYEREIRETVRKLDKINNLFDLLVQADESDFENLVTEPDLVGRKIGSFEITEMIGRGGMGVVYLAHDSKLKRSVAIKSVPAALAGDVAARTRFRREAELLASLNHPNIAVIHDMVEEEWGAGYLVLEYVPGDTLAERIEREPLTLAQAVSIGGQIVEAVAAAHERGIIHRDLKPGNIKITPEGRVKVLDFGLAKDSKNEDQPGDITTTQPGRVVGTPAYMSPEQARGRDTDHRTDIWSFGCVLFQMLTGRLPFEGETATDTIARIIERDPEWELLAPGTPANVRDLLRRCLEKDPDRRLADIAEANRELSGPATSPVTRLPAAIPGRFRTTTVVAVLGAFIVLSTIALWSTLRAPFPAPSRLIRLVVLPFENLGPAEDEYFADGIADAITARLAGVHGLGVISRQSAMQYKGSEKSIRQIAQELQVDYVLEGTVQREPPGDPNGRVRIIPQLIRVSDDTHAWAQIFDDDLSEIFQIQSDIAKRVADELEITLLESERAALASRSTESVEAYDYYIRGNDYFYRSYLQNDLRIALEMYKKAIDLDPAFALAYSQLARSHLMMFWYAYDRSEERLAMAKQAADRALQLNPDLPEAHLALGHYYYHGHLDYDHALDQFAIARKSQPMNSVLLSYIGYAQRRQGNFEKGLASIKKACDLDPRSSLLARAAGETLLFLRRYAEAERYLERAISLAPDAPGAYHLLTRLYVSWKGSTEKSRAALQRGLENTKLTEDPGILDGLVLLDVYDRNYQEALDRLSLRPIDVDAIFNFIPCALRRAQIHGFMHDDLMAKKYYDEARSILESKIQGRLDDARLHSSLGIAYAGLGRREDAIRAGRSAAVDLLPVAKEAIGGAFRVRDLAAIYVVVGEYDAAIDQLEFLLGKPGDMSVPLLKLDPTWDPLRGHARFKQLLQSDH